MATWESHMWFCCKCGRGWMTSTIDAHCQEFDCAHVQCANCRREPQGAPNPLDHWPAEPPHHHHGPQPPAGKTRAASWDEAQNTEGYILHPSSASTLPGIKGADLLLNNDAYTVITTANDPLDAFGVEHISGDFETSTCNQTFPDRPSSPAFGSNALRAPFSQHSANPEDGPDIDPGSKSGQLLACPFDMKDRGSTAGCSRYRLRRIRDVKQHIKRKHIITKAQDKAMKAKSDSKKTQAQQWYALWYALFPGRQKPSSPYIDPRWSADMTCLRRRWKVEAPKMMRDVLQQQPDFRSWDEDRIAHLLALALFDGMLGGMDAVLAEGDPIETCAPQSPSVNFVDIDTANLLGFETGCREITPVDEVEEVLVPDGNFPMNWDNWEPSLSVDPAWLVNSGIWDIPWNQN